MGPWETSVENRLDSLDRRLGSIGGDVGQIKTDTAVLRSDMRHLPTKGYIITAVVTLLALFAALTAYADTIQSWVN